MFRVFLFLGMLAVLAVPAQAGLLGNVLTFNGTQDRIDNTAPALVAFIDNDGVGGLTIGDVGFGFVSSNEVVNDGGPGAISLTRTIVTVFAAQVGALNSDGAFQLIAPTNAAQSLYGLLNDAGNGFASVFDTAGLQSDVVAMVISSNAAQAPGDLTGFGGPTTANWLTNQFTDSDYGFEALLDLNDGGFFDLYQDPLFPALATQSGGFNVAKHSFGPSTQFLDVTANRVPSLTSVAVDVGLSVVNISPSDPDAPENYVGRGWTLTGNASSVTVNAVPEPTTVLAFVSIGLAGVGASRRRVRKASA